jgi:FixJ family two-component response regulator
MSTTGALVYVVDDDPSAREGVAGLIRSAGLRAQAFASAEEFLAAPRPELPSCLVLDVSLPGVSDSTCNKSSRKPMLRFPSYSSPATAIFE